MSSSTSELSEGITSPLNENISDPTVSSILPASAREPSKVSLPTKSETQVKSARSKRSSRQSTTIQNSTKIAENGSTHTDIIQHRSKMNRNEKHEQAEESVTKDKDNKARLELKISVKKWIDELFDLTADNPKQVTKKMLDLRMCIDLESTGEHLMDGQEIIVKSDVDTSKHAVGEGIEERNSSRFTGMR